MLRKFVLHAEMIYGNRRFKKHFKKQIMNYGEKSLAEICFKAKGET